MIVIRWLLRITWLCDYSEWILSTGHYVAISKGWTHSRGVLEKL